MDRLKRESSFGPKAVSLARSAATAFASLRDKPGFTMNSVASSMPEIASLLVGGGIRTPQPAFLQWHLKADVKDALRESCNSIIRSVALGRGQTQSAQAASAAATRGQDASKIGPQADTLLGGEKMKIVFGTITDKFINGEFHLDEGHRASALIERIAEHFKRAVDSMSEGQEAFETFLFGDA